jgi:hypothetical protein
MKSYRTESVVVTNSGHRHDLKGHLNGAEVVANLRQFYPGSVDRHGEPVTYSGRCAHLEKDGYESVKNFTFAADGMESDVWTAS